MSESNESLKAEIERLKAANEEMKAKANRPITFKVSEKGALSVYGLNARFPTTLYVQQWEKLLDVIPELQTFIETNRSKLAVKE